MNLCHYLFLSQFAINFIFLFNIKKAVKTWSVGNLLPFETGYLFQSTLFKMHTQFWSYYLILYCLTRTMIIIAPSLFSFSLERTDILPFYFKLWFCWSNMTHNFWRVRVCLISEQKKHRTLMKRLTEIFWLGLRTRIFEYVLDRNFLTWFL